MADYASELLGSGRQATPKPDASTDYASTLLGGAQNRPDVFAKNLQKIPEDIKGSADFATLTKAALVDDPQTKLRIFAKGRFPNLSEKDALSRYGIIDGEVYYLDDDGKVKGETASGLKNFAANVTANLPVMAAGAGGAMLAAPTTPVGMIAAGSVAAAGAKGYMKTAANLAFDEPQTVAGNIKDMAADALFEAGGNVVGLAFAKALTKGAARDLGKLDKQKVADITAKAQQQGIDLNVAQATDLPSVKAKYDVVASMPTSRDTVAQHAQKQAGQAEKAAERFIEGVSKVADVDEAGALAREGAKKVISKLTQERADAARPLYKQAFTEFQEFNEDQALRLDRLRTSPTFKDAERVAQRLYKDDLATMGEQEMAQASALRDLHYTKLALDKLIGDEAKGGYNRTSRKALIGLKDELLKIMDEASPTYGKARETFGHMTPNIVSVQDGIISKVAGLKDEQALSAAREVFADGRSPAAVERMRNLFVKSGLKDDWDAMLASHLRETFAKSGQEFATTGGQLNQAPKWRAALVGNPRQYRLMEKAMSVEQFQAFNNMMDVFEAMGRTSAAGQGSQTMGRQEGAQLLRRESGAGAMGQAAGLFSPQNWGQRSMEWLQEVRVGNHAEKLAEIMTSKDGMKRLRDLRKLSPNDQRFIAGASSLFGISLRPANKPADTPAGEAAPQQ